MQHQLNSPLHASRRWRTFCIPGPGPAWLLRDPSGPSREPTSYAAIGGSGPPHASSTLALRSRLNASFARRAATPPLFPRVPLQHLPTYSPLLSGLPCITSIAAALTASFTHKPLAAFDRLPSRSTPLEILDQPGPGLGLIRFHCYDESIYLLQRYKQISC
jgi:hypothetical protein